MDPILRHRYAAALVTTGTLFLIGTLIVVNRSAVSPSDNLSGIPIDGIIQDTNPAAVIPSTPDPVRPTAVDVPYTKVTTQQSSPVAPQSASDHFDWNSFMAALTRTPSQPKNTTVLDTSVSDAYAFIPTGLISIDEQQSFKEMSPSQIDLYGWGNSVGGTILSYENLHPDQPAILTNHIQDRQNPDKIAAMKKLGADLQAVGNSIDTVTDVPPQMSIAGPALANAYREIGRNLAAIPDAKGDDATVQAILTYNKSAEAFVQKFVSVVLIFQANDVKFTQSEPGGVFMFPAN